MSWGLAVPRLRGPELQEEAAPWMGFSSSSQGGSPAAAGRVPRAGWKEPFLPCLLLAFTGCQLRCQRETKSAALS